MTRRVAEFDWASTPLGPTSTWSPALRSTVENVLACGFGLLLWWGEDLIQIYNDAYRPVLGAKHPDRALGQPTRECWNEIFDVIGPLIYQPLHGGAPSVSDDLELVLRRNGFEEETHFSVAYSPVFDESVESGIGGVLATVQETTEKVIGERRMRLLRDLAAAATQAKTVVEQCQLAVDNMARHGRDVPFSFIYLKDGESGNFQLAASAGVDDADAARWRFDPKLRPGSVELVDSSFGVCACTPIPSSAGNESTGVLVAGVSPIMRFDERYVDFCALVAAQIGSAIASARVHEEERRRAEALAEIDRAKNVFFSNVSHEFRTPLTLMLGPLSDLSKTVGAREKPLVDSAYRNSLRLLKLVNTLLEFSRLEAGRAEATYAKTDLAALTEEICSVFRSAIESAGLKYRVDVALDGPVYVDRSMWEKIVLNLLSNALKFTLAGEIRVSLRRARGYAELRVSDSGVGIPAGELPHVFERFRRVRATTSRSHEGSGIGLALVKDLVDLHRGSIQAESEFRKGTTFIVRVPFGSAHLDAEAVENEPSAVLRSGEIAEQYLAEVDSTITRSAETSAPPGPATGAKQRSRILLADDNGDLRDYVSRLLSREYDVTAVRNGVEALDAARELRFDAIISDVMMPEMDGFELLKAVRADPDLATTPFIMLSARAGPEHALEGVTIGADDYIAKPFSAEELRARVRANLNAGEIRQRAWELSEEQFRTFAEAVPVIVWSATPDGYVDWYNNRWYAYTGHDPEESLGWGWQGVPHLEDLPKIMEAWPHSLATGARFEMELRLRGRDGRYRWFLTRAEAHRDDCGNIVRWYGSYVDVDAQKHALEGSKRVAEALQSVFLPDRLPRTANVRFDAIYVAAEKDALIGGDWFDAVQLPNGSILISIGDVAGHGVGASITAASIRQSMIGYALTGADPAEILKHANRVTRFQYPETFATAIVGIIDRSCEVLSYASAGHPAPFLAETRDAPARPLDAGGIPLGIADTMETVLHRLPITRDAVLVLYTDGLTEFARDIERAEKTMRSVMSDLVGNASVAHPAVAVQKAVLGENRPVDDVAILLAQFGTVDSRMLPVDPESLVKEWRFHSSDAQTARTSRHELTKFIHAHAADMESVYVAELIFGEILANTVEHAPGLVLIRIDWSDELPVATIRDSGPGLRYIIARLPETLDDGGRGLFLIKALAADVSIDQTSDAGTELRVVLPVPRKAY
ncbi:MAG TPA: SpoIIE family protein phosphatase [Candidatus Baltobacteraceae bacterium]